VSSQAEQHRYEIGADVGGTFTDCVLADRDSGRVFSCKVLTTHYLPSRAIFDGFARLCEQAGIQPADVGRFVHTTTLVGNAVIEHRGQRTALIATRGFRDVLHLRREYRYDLFEALIEFPTPLIPRALSFELDERIGAAGNVIRTLDDDESVAVCLLHAYANPAHEQRVGELLAKSLPGVTVSLSTRVLPKIREYERTSATAINAYVQPLVARYLDDLTAGLRERGCAAQLLIVTSIGGTVGVDTAKALPIQLVESGPAAGVVFAARLGTEQQVKDLVAFDMGGTTAKVCIVRDGTPQVRTDLEVARARRFKPGSGMPVGVPLFDLLEIGAGGGSVAGIDDAGLVRVGPRSVGSTPGPACYGRGGTEATVTDANLVLGYIDPEALLGGERALDLQAARRAIDQHLARPLGLTTEAAAEAIIRIVNESMADALRMRSVESNVDVRRFTMMAFGGGGGLHGVEIARLVGVGRVVCPPRAGVFCAAGLLVSPVNVETLRSRIVPLEQVDTRLVDSVFVELEVEARDSVAAFGQADYRTERWVDMSYVGQEYELPVPMPASQGGVVDHAALQSAFEQAYRSRYGRILKGYPTRVVTWRLRLVGPSPGLIALKRDAQPAPVRQRRIWLGGRWLEAAIHDRRALTAGLRIAGPAVVQDVDTTLLVPLGAHATCEADGTLIVTIGAASS
jgi:N-methylhydantoinase A/oxoprolinase/acetone carboxylase beta subunit